jgi:hypothetical protein
VVRNWVKAAAKALMESWRSWTVGGGGGGGD